MGIIEELQRASDFRSLSGASDEQIKEAERILRLTFADDYREYLKVFGLASVFGHEFTGICPSERLNVVSVTVKKRRLFSSVPLDWYVLEQTNMDGIIIWQNGEGEVFAAAESHEPEKIAGSFSDYVKEDIEDEDY